LQKPTDCHADETSDSRCYNCDPIYSHLHNTQRRNNVT
jgi:hypothetical protein